MRSEFFKLAGQTICARQKRRYGVRGWEDHLDHDRAAAWIASAKRVRSTTPLRQADAYSIAYGANQSNLPMRVNIRLYPVKGEGGRQEIRPGGAHRKCAALWCGVNIFLM
jgi:hypothetical protein